MNYSIDPCEKLGFLSELACWSVSCEFLFWYSEYKSSWARIIQWITSFLIYIYMWTREMVKYQLELTVQKSHPGETKQHQWNIIRTPINKTE